MASNPEHLAQHIESVIHAENRTALRKHVIPALFDAISAIGQTLRQSQNVSLAGTANAFGDDQLNVDVLSEKHMRDAIAKCPAIVTASSEEDPVERGSPGASAVGTEQYTIAFDPLDGSSIIAPNWSVGSIIGIWDGSSAVGQTPSEKQVGAILGVFGPRTTAIVALRLPDQPTACFEVGLDAEVTSGYELIRSHVNFAAPPFKTRYFAPANLRAAAEDEKYLALVNRYIREKYTLRYSGGLVPDLVHALVKGNGVYISPVTSASKPKLRKLYELFPVALIMECAGGKAVDPVDGKRILDTAAGHCDEKGGLVCGTTEEVEIAIKTLLG